MDLVPRKPEEPDGCAPLVVCELPVVAPFIEDGEIKGGTDAGVIIKGLDVE